MPPATRDLLSPSLAELDARPGTMEAGEELSERAGTGALPESHSESLVRAVLWADQVLACRSLGQVF